MTVTFIKTTSMEMVNTSGLMVESTTVNGSTTRWKAKAPSPGAMVVYMLVNTRMIRSMVTVLSNGQMAENTSESGTKESNTGKVHT